MKPRVWLGTMARLHRRSPNFLLAVWFFILLFTGTLLLALPLSHRPGGPEVTLLTALFTAVSAFCVTGLTVVDTYDAFSGFGQLVILVLIEMGGVGIMTFANLAFAIIGRRLSMAGQSALTDTLFQNDAAREFRSIFSSMLKAVVLVQLAGVLALFLSLGPHHIKDGSGFWYAIWSAVFHSVSAFCNAGFSIYHDNLVPMAGNRAFLATIAILVIVGGLGLGLLAEIYRLPRLLMRSGKRKPHWLSLNSRVSLYMTGTLLVTGALLVTLSAYILGDEGTDGIIPSIFHSVVARTAGFNCTLLDKLPLSTCLFMCSLMFIGGCPGSCAGGVKTTSLAIWIARIGSNLRHDPSVNILGFTIAQDLVSKARIIMALSTLWVTTGVVILSVSEPQARLDVLLFEQVSAFATVGLTMGITPHLNDFSQIWIILSMIMGKFGPLTIALWMISFSVSDVKRPVGRLMIG